MRDFLPRVALPDVTAAQMGEVDRVMVEEVGIGLLQMMENAGRSLAELAASRYAPASTAVLVGSGGNGGGGLVAARHLHNRGVAVHVTLAAPDRMTGVPARQLEIVERMGVAVDADPRSAHLVVDALLGYGVEGSPRGRAAELIRWANRGTVPVLALDAPSGLDLTTGSVADPCIVADATLTVAMPKVGLRLAPQVVGDLFAADISVPDVVYTSVGLQVTAPFAAGPIVRVR